MTEDTFKAIGDGMSASDSALIGASVAEDLSAIATSFKIPYYVIQGRHDLFAPTPLVEAYFNKVSAPKKRLIIIEDAGHFALATRGDRSAEGSDPVSKGLGVMAADSSEAFLQTASALPRNTITSFR